MLAAPISISLAELRARIYALYPMFAQYQWIDDALRELYANGAPDPNPRNEGKRIIIPSQWIDFARLVARRVGIELNATTQNRTAYRSSNVTFSQFNS